MTDTHPNRPLDPRALDRLRLIGRPFEPADEIESLEDVAVFLDEYLRDNDDQNAFIKALGVIARSKGMTEIASRAGVGRESLYKSLSGRTAPTFETVTKVLAALGLQLTVTPKLSEAAREAVT